MASEEKIELQVADRDLTEAAKNWSLAPWCAEWEGSLQELETRGGRFDLGGWSSGKWCKRKRIR